MATQYKVLNPRGLPKGTIIISNRSGELSWTEGQTFEKPPEMADSSVAGMVADGLLEAIDA